LLHGKRVVYLGEANHWIHEKYDYRVLLLRYLVSRGWRCIGEEMGWSDGGRVDRYLDTGDRTHLERVTIYGYRGAWRHDRRDEPTGIIKDAWESFPEAEFASEQMRFAEALRRMGRDRPWGGDDRLRFFGFDVDYVAGGAYEDLEDLFHAVRGDAVIGRLRGMLARVRGETIEAEILRLHGVLGTMEAEREHLRNVLGNAAYDQAHVAVRNLRDSIDYIRVAHPAQDWETLSRALAAREQAMCRNLEHVLEAAGAGDKIVLLGQNLHLSKDLSRIGMPVAQGGPGGGQLPSLGEYICRRLPGQVLSIWMLYNRGRDCQPFTWLSRELRPVPGSLNAALAEVGLAFLLPLASPDPRAAPLATEMDVVAAPYNTVSRLAIAAQADAIVFVRDVSPLWR
jgi:erythromycin esterase-like protein